MSLTQTTRSQMLGHSITGSTFAVCDFILICRLFEWMSRFFFIMGDAEVYKERLANQYLWATKCGRWHNSNQNT